MPLAMCTQPWEFAVAPFRMVGPLYYVGNLNVSCHLIDTGAGLILIDTAFPQTVYLLLESIRRLGFDPANIAHILHTHAHYDHCGGTRALVELTGAKTFLGKDDVEIIESRHEMTWAPEYGVEFYETFHADEPIQDGQTVTLGAVSVECVHTPGHTPGTMSYFFQVEEGGRRRRVGLMGGPGLNTLTDEYLAKHGLPKSRRTDYLRSVEGLMSREVDVVLGAHPAQNDTFGKRDRAARGELGGAGNPFVNPSEWTRYLTSLAGTCRRLFGA